MDWSKNRAIALGFFDGVHRGHQALLERTREYGAENNITPTALSFDTHPTKTVSGKAIPLINTPYDREKLINRVMGIKDVIFLHFDELLMKMEWDQFIKWLAEDFNAKYLVAGFDFHFGYKGLGDADKLRAKCSELGIGCDIVEKVTMGGEKISSTYVRELLENGDIILANKCMGHPHTLTETVRYGYRFGRTIGLPTVNMCIPNGIVMPKKGVYAAKAYLENGESRLAVTNVGTRPTVSGGSQEVTVESHLLDYSGNLYGKQVRLEFYGYIRPETKFSDATELKNRIHEDIKATRAFFEK